MFMKDHTYLFHDQHSRRRCHDLILFFVKILNSGSIMSEMSIRTRSASSYDNYLFPGMIGGLAMLRGMKYLAFKRVLFPSIINQSKKYF